jgi:hypothetical protein
MDTGDSRVLAIPLRQDPTATPTPNNECDINGHCATQRFATILADNHGIIRVWGDDITAADPYIDYGSTFHAVWVHPSIPDGGVTHWLEIGITKNSVDNVLRVYGMCGGCNPGDPDKEWMYGKDLPNGGGVSFSIMYDSSDSSWNWYADGDLFGTWYMSNIGNYYLPSKMRLIATGGETGGSKYNDIGVGFVHGLRFRTSNCVFSPCSTYFVPTDTQYEILHGPPPIPGRYFSHYHGPGHLSSISDCHKTNSCQFGR